MTCCDLHKEPDCCDPDDCGPLMTPPLTHLELDIPDDVAIDLCWLADQHHTTPHDLATKALRWYVTAARRRTHK